MKCGTGPKNTLFLGPVPWDWSQHNPIFGTGPMGPVPVPVPAVPKLGTTELVDEKVKEKSTNHGFLNPGRKVPAPKRCVPS